MSTQVDNQRNDDDFIKAMELTLGSVLPMVLRAAAELNLFEIMAKKSTTSVDIGADQNNLWSSYEIVGQLPTKNTDAPVMLERILRFLASNNILTYTVVTDNEDGKEKSLYGLAPVAKYFVRDQDGISQAPMLLLLQDKVIMDSWFRLKDAIIEGGVPFDKAHGMHAFEYPAIDSRFNEVFNNAMYNSTTPIMKMVLEVYDGFKDIQEVVDVGGGLGQTLEVIISRYPHIKGINFDLPHVVKDASPIAGVVHVGGDMFESVPIGETIFLKWILHDWGDEHCLKLLKNCWKALRDNGKVIVVESILPEHPNKGSNPTSAVHSDMVMLVVNPGGKERTEKQFETLATKAGFASSKIVCQASAFVVIEFHK